MEQEMTVSVLMLTYNHRPFIQRALESVLGQVTDFPYEVVISDDASGDGTWDILRSYRAQFKDRIVLMGNGQNQGLIPNFMRAYSACRRKYVAICEGDDFWISRHKPQRQVRYLESHPGCSLTFHRAENYYQDRRTKSLSNPHQKADCTCRDLASSNFITNVTAVFRKAPTATLPDWFPEVSTYDYPLHMLTAATGTLHYFPQPMAVYRQRREAIWSRADQDKKWEISLNSREKLMAYFQDVDAEVFQRLRLSHLRICQRLISETKDETGKEAIRQRLLHWWPDQSWTEISGLFPKTPPPSAMRRHLTLLVKGIRGAVSWLIPLPRIRAIRAEIPWSRRMKGQDCPDTGSRRNRRKT